MIRIIEGNPGSGKSYYFINYLVKFCVYDKMYDEFIVREDVLVISNVSGLRIKHKNLDTLIQQKGSVEEFFTVENFENLQKVYRVKNIILGIDEAQRYFDSKFFNKDVFFLFQFHRHIGLDVFFITQSRSTIARHLIPLCEYVMQAKERTKAVPGVFQYRVLDQKGNELYTTGATKKEVVFRAYKSFDNDEFEKPKNLIWRYVVMVSVVAIGAGLCWKSVFAYFDKKAKPETVQQVTKNTPLVPPKTIDFQQSSASSQPLKPVFGNISSMSQVKVIDRIREKMEWETVEIQGYVRGQGKLALMINGKKYMYPNGKIRHLDLDNKTCQIKADPDDKEPLGSFGDLGSKGVLTPT